MICDKQNIVEGEPINGAMRYRVVRLSGRYSDVLTCGCKLTPAELPSLHRRSVLGAYREIQLGHERAMLRTPHTKEHKQSMQDWLRTFATDIPIGILRAESFNGE